MPKRVHSASDRDDDGESTSNQSASKRTRKATELVCQFHIHSYIDHFIL
jgi:hypothetical protein